MSDLPERTDFNRFHQFGKDIALPGRHLPEPHKRHLGLIRMHLLEVDDGLDLGLLFLPGRADQFRLDEFLPLRITRQECVNADDRQAAVVLA